MSTLLCIDGSLGEGGGQIIRSSLALSMVTGRPISIDKIRAGRDKPGLRTQDVTAVAAAAQLCRAKVSGLEIGSRKLSFEPGPVRPGEYHFRIGTAGSATLVLQTVLPALLVAQGSSELTLEGGTHNPWAPPFDFLQRAFLPLINRMGPKATATLIRHGFYPAGGGCFEVTIEPSSRVTGFDLLGGLVLAEEFEAEIGGKKAIVEYEPDPELSDTEQVPLLEDGGIEAFIRREVLPYSEDAWIEESKTKIGYEISFTRHFYKPQPLRTLEEISADILAIEKEAEGLLDDLLKGTAK